MLLFLLCAYAFSCSFTSAFAFSEIITLPNIFLGLSAIFLLVKLAASGIRINRFSEDIYVVLFLSIAFFSFCLNNIAGFNAKSLNHLIAYSFSVIVLFFVFRSLLLNSLSSDSDKFIFLKWVYRGVYFACFFGVLEFVTKNFLGFQLDEIVPRSLSGEYNPTVLGEYIRIRSFVQESGHFALFLEILGPLAFYYKFYSKYENGFVSKALFIVVFSMAFIFTLSTIAFANVVIVLLILFINHLYKIIKKKTVSKRFLFTGIVFFIIITVITYYLLFVNDFLGSILNEVLVGKLSSSGSADDRSNRVQEVYRIFLKGNWINFLFGYGPGAYDRLKIESIISLYVNLFLELGLLGLTTFILLVKSIFRRVLLNKNRYLRTALMISLITASIHYIGISNYWYPWIWMLFAVIQYFDKYPIINSSK